MAKRNKFSGAALRRLIQAELATQFPEAQFDERLYGRTWTDVPSPEDPQQPIIHCDVRRPWDSGASSLEDAAKLFSRELAVFLVSRRQPKLRLDMPHYYGGQIALSATLQLSPLPVPEWSERELIDQYVDRERNAFSESEAMLRVMETETLLADRNKRLNPYGWLLLECQMFDSSRLGLRTLMSFGPENTWKSIPTHPVSPRGLASDMSVVLGVHLNYPHHIVKEPVNGQG